MTDVVWAADGVNPFVEESDVVRAVTAAMQHGGRAGEDVSVVFVREHELTKMHAEIFDDPTPTDVITLDLGEEGEGPVGELFVSVDRALEVVRERGGRARDEALLYVVHGCLHLTGFDDHEDEEREAMRVAERAVLDALGVAQLEGPHEFGDG